MPSCETSLQKPFPASTATSVTVLALGQRSTYAGSARKVGSDSRGHKQSAAGDGPLASLYILLHELAYARAPAEALYSPAVGYCLYTYADQQFRDELIPPMISITIS